MYQQYTEVEMVSPGCRVLQEEAEAQAQEYVRKFREDNSPYLASVVY